MVFDLWVPEYNLAIEYQGEQHFHDLNMVFGGTVALYGDRDNSKKQAAFENGIRLLTIPYWWDREISSLAATLHHYLPESVVQRTFQ